MFKSAWGCFMRVIFTSHYDPCVFLAFVSLCVVPLFVLLAPSGLTNHFMARWRMASTVVFTLCGGSCSNPPWLFSQGLCVNVCFFPYFSSHDYSGRGEHEFALMLRKISSFFFCFIFTILIVFPWWWGTRLRRKEFLSFFKFSLSGISLLYPCFFIVFPVI